LRLESIDRPTYGLTPAPGYTATDQRFLLHADVRSVTGMRAFAQFSAAASGGRFPVRSVDRSDIDVQQAFLDLPLDSPRAVLRIGRQELDGDGLRLISSRDSSNLRRAFDMAQVDVRPNRDRFSLFYGRPVANRSGAFDDRASDVESFAGVIARHGWTDGAYHGTFGLFAFERRRALAVFQDARGRERRDTFGIRLAGDAPRYSFALSGGRQSGSIGASKIAAYGLSGEAFGKTKVGRMPIKLGATFGVASGDRRSGDATLGTFDPLYPNLGYYTDAAVSFPANVWDMEPQVSVRPIPSLELQAGVDLTSRLSNFDAVYQSGIPRLPGFGAGGSYLGALYNLKAAWTPTAHVALSASFVHGSPGAVIERADGKTFDFAFWQIAYRY